MKLRFDPNRRIHKNVATVALFSMLFQLFYPSTLVAQSSGSGQSETAGGTPTGQMVDLFTGDFNYSIPLMNVDGFPLTLTYNGNTTMNQEASWVGLGFDLNPGSINREMRGLPDDFSGDVVERTTSAKQNTTKGKNYGISAGISASLGVSGGGGSVGASANAAIEMKAGRFTNSYTGNGFNFESLPTIGANVGMSFRGISGGMSVQGGLSFSANSSTGIGGSSFGSFGTNMGVSFLGLGVSQSTTATKGMSNDTRAAKSKFESNSTSTSRSYIFAENSRGTGSHISLGIKTYTPALANSYISLGFFKRTDLGVSAGIPVPVVDLNASVGVLKEKYFSTGTVVTTDNSPAFGYMNMEKGDNVDGALLDYNRENVTKVTESMKVLPVTNLTYDIFRTSGSTSSGSFRGYRNDIGTVFNSRNMVLSNTSTKHKDLSVSVTTLPLPFTFVGSSYAEGTGNNTSNGSSESYVSTFNLAGNNLNYHPLEGINLEAETFYFKKIGEQTPSNESFFDNYGGNYASNIQISTSNTPLQSQVQLYSQLANYQNGIEIGSPVSLPSLNYDTLKQNRNTIYTQITALESYRLGDDKIVSYDTNSLSTPYTVDTTESNRRTTIKLNHHLSKMQVVNPSGVRYNYDTPVYSLMEKQVSFSDSGNTFHTAENLINYIDDVENKPGNTRGRDDYYSSTTIPGYAHSFLLNSILSTDYSDRTGDGLSEDDYGSYLKLNYTQVYGEGNPFRWKTPYNKDGNSQAIFVENNQTYSGDDMGIYTYGEKEMWYMHSVEGKNYIAKFYLSDRDDLISTVNDESGELSTTKHAKKLDKIILYSKADLDENGNSATPIQTVHFEYDYSLCKRFHGNKNSSAGDATSGKLTLKKIYTTYGNSQKGSLSPYEFAYGGTNANFIGDDVDRWGVYKSDATKSGNVKFPYALQSQASRDDASSSWSLTKITLPSGGDINVTYESDDYDAVQGERAMAMVGIGGFGYKSEVGGTSPTVSPLFRNSSDKKDPRAIIYLDLPVAINTTSWGSAWNDFVTMYVGNLVSPNKKLYYQCEVETKRGNGDYELVTGYLDVVGFGVTQNTTLPKPYIEVELKTVKDDDFNEYKIHPIQKDAWQHFRQNVSRAIYPDGVGNSAGLDISTVFSGLNKALNNKKYAWKIDASKSYIGMLEPTRHKLGGGNRVKRITYTDNWANMLPNEDNYSYGQEYSYETTIGPRGNETTVSSGVVQYEPQAGNGINPLKNPVDYKVKNEKYPWDYYYHTGPFGESFYDAAYVGYSKVTVKNLKNGVVNEDMGTTVYDYHTCKEANLRTRTDKTPLTEVKIEAFSGTTQIDFMAKSQGFVIEKNDMHGKLKQVTNYDADDNEVSSENYIYKGVNETCTVVNPDGTIEEKLLAKDYDFVHDINYSKLNKNSYSESTTYMFGIPPYSTSESTSSSIEGYLMSSFTKVIHNYAVLDKVVTRYLGAETVSNNLAYDALTGNVIATTTNNEYDDEIKSLSFPAYWHYDGMGQAVNTINNHLYGVDIASDGTIGVSNEYAAENYFRQGDELLIESAILGNFTGYKAWVLEVDTAGANNDLFLIDENGDPLAADTDVNVRVIRSGYRNQQMASMSSFVDLDPQMADLDANQPIGASAVEYSEDWKILCNDCNPYADSIVNPFEHGLLGVWRTNKSYAYQIDRSETNTDIGVDLRKGGTYSTYAPFYAAVSGIWYSIKDAAHPDYNAGSTENWLLANEITEINQSGAPIEAKDVLSRYSGVLFKYNNNEQKIPVAAANNAQTSDLAFDGFEDYINYTVYVEEKMCATEGHFDFERSASYNQIVTTEAHTGRKSLKLTNGQSVSVTRLANNTNGTCEDPITTAGYKVCESSCKQLFNPGGGTKYVISAWVKEDSIGTKALFNTPEIEVITYGPVTIQDTLVVTERITIDGWQQIEGTFSVSASQDSIEVKLRHNGTSSPPVYFDDLRIHPFNSTMVTSVYDPVSFRKWADLDDYNYATFYEYNEQGIMVRVKQETIEGIKTISETRSSIVKH